MTDMDVAATATRLGVSERTVRRWLRDGRLTGYRVGRRIRIPEHAVSEAIAPYGGESGLPAPPDQSADPLLRYLFDPERERVLRRRRREAAARVMDEIALGAGPAKNPEDTAVSLIRAVRDEEERKWDRILGLDRR
jgi:excisionase family DNA binding protein